MTKKPLYLCIAVAAFFIGMLFGPVKIGAATPGILSYQGRVLVSSVPFTGTGQFKFALVNSAGTTTFWSNDGTSTNGSEPTAVVSLAVANGLYSVLLGDTTISGMTQAIPATAFDNADVRLRIWFNDGTNGSKLLSPDQRIAPVGYAQVAKGVDDGSITTAKLADGAVTGAKIAALPKAHVRNGSVQNLPTNTEVVVQFDTEVYDVGSIHSETVNNSRLTAPQDGIYTVSANIRIDTAINLGTAELIIRKTTVGNVQSKPLVINNRNSNSTTPVMNISGLIQLNAGDYVELIVTQGTGSAATISASDDFSSFNRSFMIAKLP